MSIGRENVILGRKVTPTSVAPSDGATPPSVSAGGAERLRLTASRVTFPAASRAVTVKVWLPTARWDSSIAWEKLPSVPNATGVSVPPSRLYDRAVIAEPVPLAVPERSSPSVKAPAAGSRE